MSNPWGVKLKKTGLNEDRLNAEQNNIKLLETRQNEMATNSFIDKEKKNIYEDRQGSLAANAKMGQQGILGGRRKRKSTKRRTNSKRRKTSKRRKYVKLL